MIAARVARAGAAARADSTTVSGQAVWPTPITRSANPACPAAV